MLIIKRFNRIKICNKKWIEVNDLSSGQYSVNKNIGFKTSILKSDLCDYSDAYIFVKGTIDILAADANKNDKAQKSVAFKNNTPQVFSEILQKKPCIK